MPKLKRISIKQRNFLKELIETNSITEAAMRAYDCKNRTSAGVVGQKVLRNPLVKMEMERLFEEKNLDDNFLIQRLKEGIDAKVVSNFRGDVFETDIPDHSAAYKWWEAAAKMKEYFPAEKSEVKNLNIDMQLESMPKEEMVNLLKGLLGSMEKKDETKKDDGKFVSDGSSGEESKEAER